MAQDRGGRRGGGVGSFGDPLDNPQQGGQQAEQQQDPYAEDPRPFIDGVYFGAGINIFQGDFSANPNNNLLKHLGSAELNVLAGADKRFGAFEQYSLGAELEYNFLSGQLISGQQRPNQSFSTHTLSLDFVGNYDIPFVSQNLFRVFVGVGPMFVISPSYDNFPSPERQQQLANEGIEGEWQGDLGTRVTGAVKFGLIIQDRIRIGIRAPFTDYVDGHSGINAGGSVDLVTTINLGYRINLRKRAETKARGR
jgi:hypothetical protein